MRNRIQAAEQLRRALQMLAMMFPDEKAMEVAAVYESWQAGRTYATGTFLTYGLNSVGDPQLYKVVQAHTSQEDWKPDVTVSLYAAIGLNKQGYPVWSQPSGAHDAYGKGDIVDCNGKLYVSLIDGNIYFPETYSEVWTIYVEENS